MKSMKSLLTHTDALTEQTIAELCPAPFDQEALYQRCLAKSRGEEAAPPEKRIRRMPVIRMMSAAACLLLTLGLVTGVWTKLRRIEPLPPEDPTESAVTDTTTPTEEGITQPSPSEGEAPTVPAALPTDPQSSAEPATDPTEPPASPVTDPTERAAPTEHRSEPSATDKPPRTTEVSSELPTLLPTDPPTESPTDWPEQPTWSPTDWPEQPTWSPTDPVPPEPTDAPQQPVKSMLLAGFTITKYSDGSSGVTDSSGRKSPDGMIEYEFSGLLGSGGDDPSARIQKLRHNVYYSDPSNVTYEVYINDSAEPYYLWQKRRETFSYYFSTDGWCEQAGDESIWVYQMSWTGDEISRRILIWRDDDYCFQVSCGTKEEQPLLEELMEYLHQTRHGDRITS